jgi:hypothetical protein
MEFTPANAYTIDEGAVGGFQIVENPAPISEHRASVTARNVQVREHHVATPLTPKEQFLVPRVPVKRYSIGEPPLGLERQDLACGSSPPA